MIPFHVINDFYTRFIIEYPGYQARVSFILLFYAATGKRTKLIASTEIYILTLPP